MPTTAPKYVRLAQHMLLGCQVDINTGWGISGRDVQEVPDDPDIQAYVRFGINRGIFEEASAAEYEEVQATAFNPLGDEDIPKVIMIDPTKPIPENVLDRLVREHGRDLESRMAKRTQELLDDEEHRNATDLDLRSRLSAKGIASGGTRADVVARLRQVEGSSQPSDVTQTKSYDDMSKKELQAAARAKGLPTNGSVDDLVERLEQKDQEDAQAQGS